jgi:putative proteasome-type protease
MRSNVTVGPPLEILLYRKDSFQLDSYRRLMAGDRELETIHALWERYLRNAVEDLPDLTFGPHQAHDNQTVLL